MNGLPGIWLGNKDNNMKRIFITGAGGAGTITAIKQLKKNIDNYIVAGDMNSYAYGFKEAHKSYILPAASSEEYMEAIGEIIINEKIDYYIPLVDEEIFKAYEIADKYAGLKLLLPNKSFSEMTLDKYRLYQKLSENGILSPLTKLESNIEAVQYPVFVKPRTGRGSRNVSLINDKKQLEAFKLLSGVSGDDLLLQEYLTGDEYTVSVVVNSSNSVYAIVPKKVIVKKGITLLAETSCVLEIEEVCLKIVEKFNPCGPFNVQLMFADGKPSIFEINPRYSTTLSLTLESGVDEIGILLDKYEEKYNGELVSFKSGIILARHWESVFYEK